MKTATLVSESSLSLPADSYIYKILQTKTQNGALAAISSDDSLRIIDAETLQLKACGLFNKTHEGVTCLETFDADPNCVLTTGRDGAGCCWDLRSGEKTFEVHDAHGASYLSLDSKGLNVAAGTELTQSQATVTIWDSRSMKNSFVYTECHSDDISRLQFHPANPSYLLSGSTDGLVNIYDTAVPDEEEALFQITNHGSSIHHAGFLSSTEFYALSHDENLSVYHVIKPHETVENAIPFKFGDLRSVLHCEYVIDIIPLGNGQAIIGTGIHSTQELGLVPLQFGSQWSIPTDQAIRLNGGHGSEIVRSMCLDDASQKVFTAGEDGLVKVWQIQANDEEENKKENEEQSQPRDKKAVLSERLKKSKSGKEKIREKFAPY
ncbi:hypothetical protein MMC07_005242 [Pseudocyphellaria aurata]|nr:hypothetical protein [Pseudocyphellaria aurata]